MTTATQTHDPIGDHTPTVAFNTFTGTRSGWKWSDYREGQRVRVSPHIKHETAGREGAIVRFRAHVTVRVLFDGDTAARNTVPEVLIPLD